MKAFLIARAREKTGIAGLGLIAAGLIKVCLSPVDPTSWQMIAAGLVAFFLPEGAAPNA